MIINLIRKKITNSCWILSISDQHEPDSTICQSSIAPYHCCDLVTNFPSWQQNRICGETITTSLIQSNYICFSMGSVPLDIINVSIFINYKYCKSEQFPEDIN